MFFLFYLCINLFLFIFNSLVCFIIGLWDVLKAALAYQIHWLKKHSTLLIEIRRPLSNSTKLAVLSHFINLQLYGALTLMDLKRIWAFICINILVNSITLNFWREQNTFIVHHYLILAYCIKNCSALFRLHNHHDISF